MDHLKDLMTQFLKGSKKNSCWLTLRIHLREFGSSVRWRRQGLQWSNSTFHSHPSSRSQCGENRITRWECCEGFLCLGRSWFHPWEVFPSPWHRYEWSNWQTGQIPHWKIWQIWGHSRNLIRSCVWCWSLSCEMLIVRRTNLLSCHFN